MLSKLKGNTFLAGSAVYLISNILTAAIPFALLPVLTRYLGVNGYGQIGMFQTLLSILGAFVGLNVFGVINRKYYEYSDCEDNLLREFMAACLQILLGSTVIVLFLVFIFRVFISELVGLETGLVVTSVVLVSFLKTIQVRLLQWQIRKKSTQYGVFQVSQNLLDVLLSLIFVTVLYLGVEGRIGAQLLATGVFSFVSLLLLKRDNLLTFLVWRPNYIKEALSYGVPLIPHVGGIFLLTVMDRLIINKQLGVEGVGIYMLAVQMTMALTIIFNAVNKAYVPWLFERLNRNIVHEKMDIVKYTYVWFLVIFIFVFFLFLSGPKLVLLIAGNEFSDSGELIGWLALGQGFGGMYLMVTNYVHYSKKTGLLSLVTIFSGVVNVFLLLFMVKFFGLLGAAKAFCIASGLRFFLTWWVAQRRHPMPWFTFTKYLRQS